MTARPDWLFLLRGPSPLIVSMPHTGIELDVISGARPTSRWLARKDADWWIHLLYDFAPSLGATIVRTQISRTVIDCNRDPTGKSLYPGQYTTELCPTTTFDGEPLYRDGMAPAAEEIAARRERFFAPYHTAIKSEIARLRTSHRKVVLFDAHSIRSRIPRLFEGELPHFNIGTNGGASCGPRLTQAIEAICDATEHSRVTNGRFKGGYTTRHYGAPAKGVHALQLELAMRAYLNEPDIVTLENWPVPYAPARAAGLRAVLKQILEACIEFAREENR